MKHKVRNECRGSKKAENDAYQDFDTHACDILPDEHRQRTTWDNMEHIDVELTRDDDVHQDFHPSECDIVATGDLQLNTLDMVSRAEGELLVDDDAKHEG